MLALYLLRHAKADPVPPSLDDFERPLSQPGRAAASLAGTHMKNMGFRPALVICSGARRARETMEAVRPCLGEPAFSVEPGLYLADAGILLHRLRQVEAGKVMMIGHNPGLARLAITLAGDGPPTELARLRHAFPTTAFAEIRFSTRRWSDVVPGSGRLARFVVPRPDAGAP